MNMWFEIQGHTTIQNLNEQINKWRDQATTCLCQAEEPDRNTYEMGWLLYLAEYYRLLSQDQMVISQFLQDKSPRSVRTDPRLIPALKLLRTPGTDKILLEQAIRDIIDTPSPMKRKQFSWPSGGKSELITIWIVLLPLLMFKREPEFLTDLIHRDIIPHYEKTWKNVTYDYNYLNRRNNELKMFLHE
jgi:hypothetical protein